MFWTHDPDGTQIEIMEMPPESMQAQADKKLWANSIQDNESAYTTNQ
jgi:lactoylglutathione lyase